MGFAVIPGDHFKSQIFLDGLGMQAAFGHAPLQIGDLFQSAGGEQLVIAPHQIVRNGHDLAEHGGGRLVNADIVAVGFRHLAHAVGAFQQGHGQNALGFQAVVGLKGAAHQQVEFLVRAAHFHIRFQADGVVALAQGVEKFVDGNGALLAEALFKIVPFHHPGHGVAGGQPDEIRGVHRAQPAGVECDHGLFRIENFEHLAFVGFGIGEHLLFRQGRAGFGTAGRVADTAGEVSDEKDHGMPQLLKVAHLVHDHGMSQMQIRGCGVKSHFDAQRRAAGDFFAQFSLVDEFGNAAFDACHLLVDVEHGSFPLSYVAATNGAQRRPKTDTWVLQRTTVLSIRSFAGQMQKRGV